MSLLTTRRSLLLAAAAAALVGPTPRLAAAQEGAEPRFLFVVGALGGANIVDSFLPISANASAEAPGLTSFEDIFIESPAGTELRCVAPLVEEAAAGPPYKVTYPQSTFLTRHGADTAVMTMEGASVNHAVGQKRAMTGGGVDRNRTLLEAAAAAFGKDLPLAAVNMMAGAYAQPGRDPGLPDYAQQVAVADPRYFSLSTHGSRGLPHNISDAVMQRARAARAELEVNSPFGRAFGHIHSRQAYLAHAKRSLALEDANYIERLGLVDIPGLASAAEIDHLLEVFPRLRTDPFAAQAALAFLLAKNGASCAVGISPSDAVSLETVDDSELISNPQLAFDGSHNSHRVSQNVMWSRILEVVDGLITLLKETEDPDNAGSPYWARSVVYIATEFGRTRTRPPGFTRFGTGHFQNNGVVLVSPLLQGGRAYGDVDTKTGLTYGFDRTTGEPAPGTVMTEQDVYAVVAGALGLEVDGLPSVPALIR